MDHLEASDLVTRKAHKVFRLKEAYRLLGRKFLWVAPYWLICPKYVVLVKSLKAQLPRWAQENRLHWTVLSEVDLPAIESIDPRMTGTEVRRRLAEGQKCYLYWLDHSLAHYRWEATQPTYLPYLGLTVKPMEGEVCGTGIFTNPKFRRMGIHTAACVMALHRMQTLGFNRSTAFVAWWNHPSLRVERDVAEREVAGMLGYWNFGFWRCYLAEGAVHLDTPTSFHVDVS